MNDPIPTHNGRVLVIATTFPRWPEDSEPAFVYHLSAGLAKLGYQITVLAPHHKGAKRAETWDGLSVVRFQYFWPSDLQRLCYEGGILPNLKKRWSARLCLLPFLIAQFLAIGTLIRKNDIELVHSHWLIPQGYFAALWCRRYRKPYLVTAHGADVFLALTPALNRLRLYTLAHAGAVTANSLATRQTLLRLVPGINPITIPNGVDLSLFDPRHFSPSLRTAYGHPTTLLLAVGRFAEKKGFTFLMRAMPDILKECPSTKLLIAGFGPLDTDLKQEVRTLGIQDQVIFLGGLPSRELAKYYATADIFICPSIRGADGDTEGQGITILEAFASGTSVVATNVGGIPDIVKHEQTGLLVEEKNPREIAAAVIRLLGNRPLREELARNARQWAIQHAGWEAAARNFAEVYDGLLQRFPS
ncbi:glycosyltransferase family 4 protein [Candidatus Methylomirabilis sp.]|uniref:glycosyltransferase family 4 protein n=1 Tax=Candidatus Methylomirabilis sp. TaxID=2032687 RepID=UPI003076024F